MRRTARALAILTLPLALTSGATALTPAPAAAQPNLVVDLSERRLHVRDGDRVLETYRVAIGTRKHPTPTGSFTIDRIIWNPGWVPPDSPWAKGETPKKPGDPDNPMVGAKLFFRFPTYYIHGTNAPGTLGRAASHGCVRMDPDDVADLAEWVQRRGGAARSAAWFARVRASDRDTETVTLPEPVAVRIRR